MKKFGFIGPPSSRKSTLARAVSAQLKASSINAEYVPEYATFWNRRVGAIEDIWEQYLVTRKQIEYETRVEQVPCFITDSPILLGWIYSSIFYELKDKKDRMAYDELIDTIVKNVKYDMLFLLPAIGSEAEPGRDKKTLAPGMQDHIFTLSRSICDLFKIPYREIDNTDTDKAAKTVTEIIKEIIEKE